MDMAGAKSLDVNFSDGLRAATPDFKRALLVFREAQCRSGLRRIFRFHYEFFDCRRFDDIVVGGNFNRRFDGLRRS